MTLLLSSNGRTEAWPVSREEFENNAGAVYCALSNLQRFGSVQSYDRKVQPNRNRRAVSTDAPRPRLTVSLNSPNFVATTLGLDFLLLLELNGG